MAKYKIYDRGHDRGEFRYMCIVPSNIHRIGEMLDTALGPRECIRLGKPYIDPAGNRLQYGYILHFDPDAPSELTLRQQDIRARASALAKERAANPTPAMLAAREKWRATMRERNANPTPAMIEARKAWTDANRNRRAENLAKAASALTAPAPILKTVALELLLERETISASGSEPPSVVWSKACAVSIRFTEAEWDAAMLDLAVYLVFGEDERGEVNVIGVRDETKAREYIAAVKAHYSVD